MSLRDGGGDLETFSVFRGFHGSSVISTGFAMIFKAVSDVFQKVSEEHPGGLRAFTRFKVLR